MTNEMDKGEPSTLCKLLLAQLVYEKGENSFDEISESLANHVMLKDESNIPQTAEECEQLYLQLLDNAGLERDGKARPNRRKQPDWVNKLAQTLYMAYSEQLISLIKKDEEEFKQVSQELEELKNQQQS